MSCLPPESQTCTHADSQSDRRHSFILSAGKLQSKIKRNRFVGPKLSPFQLLILRCIVLLCQQQQQQLWWTYFSLSRTAFSTTTNKARINLHVIREWCTHTHTGRQADSRNEAEQCRLTPHLNVSCLADCTHRCSPKREKSIRKDAT